MPRKTPTTHDDDSLKNLQERIERCAMKIEVLRMSMAQHGCKELVTFNQQTMLESLLWVERWANDLEPEWEKWKTHNGAYNANDRVSPTGTPDSKNSTKRASQKAKKDTQNKTKKKP